MRVLLTAVTVVVTWVSPMAGQVTDPLSPVGPTWVAVELAGMPVPAEPAARRPSIAFVAGGRVSGTDGCNRINGPYTLNGERLTFGALATTRMACPGADEIGRRFAGALTGTSRFRIAAGRLELYGATGKPLAILEVKREAAPGAPVPPASGTPPAAAAPLKSKVFDWASLTAVPIPNGERRAVLDGPTETVDLLHIHVTTLAPGKVSGPPVRHLQEEVLIVKEGEVEVSLDGTTQMAGPGSILFFAAGAVTGLRNVSAAPATYYVIYYKTPKTPTH